MNHHASNPIVNAASTPNYQELNGAAAVARGVIRLMAHHCIALQSEVSLRNNRRADLMGISDKGEVIIIEIKCSKGDLLGDQKWPEYLDYCDKYYWAIPPEIDASLLYGAAFMPERTGLIVADAYGGELLRPAARHALAAARRKTEHQRLAYLAMRRLSSLADPKLARSQSGWD